MITLAHPWLAAAIADKAYPAIIDWLQDEKATLSNVLLLYAGTPPEWTDGIGQEVLAGWVKASLYERLVPIGEGGFSWLSNMVAAICLDNALANRLICEDERLRREGQRLAAAASWSGQNIEIGPENVVYKEVEALVFAVTVRDAKRRTLALFPEVKVRIIPQGTPRLPDAYRGAYSSKIGSVAHIIPDEIIVMHQAGPFST